jgi:hypothetical protein
MKHRWSSLLLLTCALASCGGKSSGPGTVQSPFLAEDAVLFDGGVEFVDNPEKLTGRWKEDWERELAQRVARADAIYLGNVSSTRLGSDFGGKAFIDVAFEIEKRLHGAGTGTIDLRSRPDDAGHRTLARADDRLLTGKYVAFVKWAEDDGAVRGRFHLAYASDVVLATVQFQLEKK